MRIRRLDGVLWFAAAVGALWFLQRLGNGVLAAPPHPLASGDGSGWRDWLAAVGPGVAVAAIARLVATGLTLYLAMLSGLWVLWSSMGRFETWRSLRLERALERLSPAFLLRLWVSARGASLSAAGISMAVLPLAEMQPAVGDSRSEAMATIAHDGAASTAEIRHVALQESWPAPGAQLPVLPDYEVLASELPTGGPSQDGMTPAAPEPEQQSPPASDTWFVETGDHLWGIATEVLADHTGKHPQNMSDADVGAYWVQLIADNRDQLADPANPDLIYPGQELVLPSPDQADAR